MLPQNNPDRIRILFDDHRLVANAGLLLPATLARHLGLPQLLRKHLDLGGAPGRANTGDKMMTLGLRPSSPSEDYLTVLAGQRQWIATTNFAGCPGRRPDSFANSAVLTTSAKVPDALGWPIGPCFPVQIDPKAEQFEQVVAGADQRPFAVHLLQSPQQELPESPALLDLAEYRLHSLHPQSVALPTPLGL